MPIPSRVSIPPIKYPNALSETPPPSRLNATPSIATPTMSVISPSSFIITFALGAILGIYTSLSNIVGGEEVIKYWS